MTPRRRWTARARRVRLVVMDVDGVLTDGRMTITERGDELKSFDSRDGVAVALARQAGLRTAMVTGEKSPIAKVRGDRLGVDAVVTGARRKGEVLEQLCAQFGVGAAEAAYIGDDLLDVPAMERAGLAIAVANAPGEVQSRAHLVTRRAGGRGAVREAVERILRAQGRWHAVVGEYVRAHGGRG